MNYNGKKVFVTGADGFIGSHLVELLVNSGANVKALSYYNSFNYWGWLEDISCINDIEVVTGDIRDQSFMNSVIHGVDIIYHLAALIAIPYSYKAPESYIDTNIKGTLNVCQAALKNNVSHIIHTSTSEVYGTAQYVPIDENHPLQPQSPYSATKIGADNLVNSFHYAYDLPVTIARPFNTYGPRQSARAVIPSIIIQIANGMEEIKLGDTKPTRDFSFVKDICSGLLLLGSTDRSIGETFNIGSGKEYSISDVFKMIQNIMGRNVELIQDKERIRPKKSEVYRLLADTSKIKNVFNYQQKYSLEDGLKETIAWFKDPVNIRKYKSEIYNV
jgi:NAD dependent epimerase/dehydratase